MRVHQPGGHLMHERGAEVEDWSWAKTRRRLGLLWRLTKPYRRRTAFSVFSLLAATATALAPPYLAKYALDDAVNGHGGTRLFVVVAIFVAAGLANWATFYIETYMTGWVGERILADLRVHLFSHLQKLSLGFFERNRAGVIISRLTNDVEAIDQLVTDGVTSLVQNMLTLLGTAVILFVLDWRLALATCAVIPLMSVATAIFRKRNARAYADVRERLGLVTATLAEDIAGMRVVQSFTREQAAFDELPRRRAALPAVEHADGHPQRHLLPDRRPALDGRARRRARLRGASLLQRHDHARNALRVHALRAELLRPRSAALAALQHVPLGDGGTRQDRRRARRAARGRRPARRTRARADRGARAHSRACASATAAATRCCTGSTSTFPPGRPSRSSATPAPASRRSRSCSRASTSRRSGRITIDGVDLNDVSQASLRRQLGVVPQEGFLFAGTVADNIAFGKPDATADEIVRAAQTVGAHEFILRLEDGYETQLGERGSRLSLGQRQLVAFARALLADPRILILDEATSSVDIGTERRIEEALRVLLADRTAFIIAHRLSTIRDADLIVVLEHGRVIEQGSHDELLAAARPLHLALRRLGCRRRVALPRHGHRDALHDRRVVLEQHVVQDGGFGLVEVVGTNARKSCRAAAGSCVALERRPVGLGLHVACDRVLQRQREQAEHDEHEQRERHRLGDAPSRRGGASRARSGTPREREERVPADRTSRCGCARDARARARARRSTSRGVNGGSSDRVPEEDAPARAETGRERVRREVTPWTSSRRPARATCSTARAVRRRTRALGSSSRCAPSSHGVTNAKSSGEPDEDRRRRQPPPVADDAARSPITIASARQRKTNSPPSASQLPIVALT